MSRREERGESMRGVTSWDEAESPLPGYEHIVAMHGRGRSGLPFVSVPGPPPTPDPERDRMIVRALELNGVPLERGSTLDYAQSEMLYRTVRDYFDHVAPLMETERWMADFVEKRGMTYTDHDGLRYSMKGGARRPHFEIEDYEDSISDEEGDS